MISEDCNLYLGDSLKYMRGLKDKSFDLCLTDPPYGIGKWTASGGQSLRPEEVDEINRWDQHIGPEYFEEIKRVSKAVIIWGGNYYFDVLGNCRSPLVWDKKIRGMHFADGEMAWTNFDYSTLRILELHISRGGTKNNRIHPTQKPVGVMRWSIEQVRPRPSIVFDPFMGSGTTAIACHQLGIKFAGCEMSPEYFEAASTRIKHETKQMMLLSPNGKTRDSHNQGELWSSDEAA